VPAGDLETISFSDATQWDAWLAKHHDRAAGVWLKIAKKGSGRTSVTTAEALDVALCYGWIDSHRKSFDEQCFLQKYSLRRPRSSWSKVNVDKVDALIAAGRMRAAGFEQVRAARADGRWERAYESQRTATVPPDLAAALDASDPAKRRFESLGKTDRYAVILRLLRASGPADRAARLRKAVDALTSNAER
jgi:uncharacterized protein YdeI (YjbR/CyaY-like superfamily)